MSVKNAFGVARGWGLETTEKKFHGEACEPWAQHTMMVTRFHEKLTNADHEGITFRDRSATQVILDRSDVSLALQESV